MGQFLCNPRHSLTNKDDCEGLKDTTSSSWISLPGSEHLRVRWEPGTAITHLLRNARRRGLLILGPSGHLSSLPATHHSLPPPSPWCPGEAPCPPAQSALFGSSPSSHCWLSIRGRDLILPLFEISLPLLLLLLYAILCSLATQTLVLGSVAWASPGRLLEMQTLRPHPRPAGSQHAFQQNPSGDLYALF